MGFLNAGLRDLSARLRLLWLLAVRWRARRALYLAETELGLLAWEQAEFYGDEITAHVKKVQEYEETQAALLNVSATLSGKKAALDEELAGEKAAHDAEQAAIAAERAPVATRLSEAELGRRQKLDAVERFDRAIEELAQTEKELLARSRAFLNVQNPTLEIRTAAREVSDALTRLPAERKLVLADRSRAAREAAEMEPGIAVLRAELSGIDARAAAARERLAATTRRIASEINQLERQRKKSHVEMSNLDRDKSAPYRAIGVCLANDGIGPLNQPEVLGRVIEMRGKEAVVIGKIAEARETVSDGGGGVWGFYFLMLAIVMVSLALFEWKH